MNTRPPPALSPDHAMPALPCCLLIFKPFEPFDHHSPDTRKKSTCAPTPLPLPRADPAHLFARVPVVVFDSSCFHSHCPYSGLLTPTLLFSRICRCSPHAPTGLSVCRTKGNEQQPCKQLLTEASATTAGSSAASYCRASRRNNTAQSSAFSTVFALAQRTQQLLRPLFEHDTTSKGAARAIRAASPPTCNTSRCLPWSWSL